MANAEGFTEHFPNLILLIETRGGTFDSMAIRLTRDTSKRSTLGLVYGSLVTGESVPGCKG